MCQNHPEVSLGFTDQRFPAGVHICQLFTDDQEREDALASFLVNQQQSIRFMRELEHVPANPVIRVDQRIYPRVNGFAQQAQSAVVIPNEIPTETLFAAGDLAYASVLSGLSTPAEALCRFSRDVAVSLGPEAVDVRLPDGCEP